MKNIPISKRESEVLSLVKDHDLIIFTLDDLVRYIGLNRSNANRIVQRMRAKGLVESVERGKYVPVEDLDSLDIYEIATNLTGPSYLAFWSALHFHHMTDQVPRKVFLATTRRKRDTTIRGQMIVFVTLTPRMFFGYERIGPTLISDREKTVIDSLRHPDHSGGISHIYDSIPEDLNTDRIAEYCAIAGSTAIASRLGYLLERRGIRFDGERIRSLITTYSLLEPSGSRSGPDRRWKLYVNEVIS